MGLTTCAHAARMESNVPIPTLVVTLPADGSAQYAIDFPDGSRLSGYGKTEWRSHVAANALRTVVIDYSTAPWEAAVKEAVSGPMLSTTIEQDEEPVHGFSYVTVRTKAKRAQAIGATVTYYSPQEARDIDCKGHRCPDCNQPTYEWGGTRHQKPYTDRTTVRTDNDAAKECV